MRPRTSAWVLLSLLALTACSPGGKATNAPPPTTSVGPALTVVALGGSATEGDGVRHRLRNAWPYLVFAEAFPLSTVFVNGALDDATIAEAIAGQAPLVAQLKPDVIEVWLGADDVRAATPIPEFTAGFTKLLSSLRATGKSRILVADLPLAYGPSVPAYNAAIHTVVAEAHAELVALAPTPITLAPTDGLSPQPDAASHRIIAAAFEKQIRRAGN